MSKLFALGRLAASVLLIGLYAASARGAERDDVRAYSYTMPVTVSGSQAVVQLSLPREVYLKSRSQDLRDLRLFDASGAPLPFALIEQAQESQATRAALPVAVFPVFSETPGSRGLPAGLQIRTSEDGSVISVTARKGSDTAARPESVSSLVLDLRPSQSRNDVMIDAPVTALAFSLPPEVRNYGARIAIEASDDLQRWEQIGEGALNWLVNSSGESVRKDRIELSTSGARYARISWLEGSPIQFASITADHSRQTAAAQRMETLSLQPQPGSFEHDLVYKSPIAIPVQTVGLELGAENVVLPVLIGTYVELPSKNLQQRTVREFQPAVKTTFFQLKQNGEQRAAREVAVETTHLAQWVVRFQGPLAEQPRLRLGWKPSTLVFVAGGKGPYTLAFGKDKARPAMVDIRQVAPGFSDRELARLERASTGSLVQQNAGAAVETSPAGQASAVHDRMLILWALLLGGVAALAFMAWRLLTQMKGEPPDSTS